MPSPQPSPSEAPRPDIGLHDSLREAEARWALMVRHIKDFAVVLIDPAGRVASWNAGAARLLGYAEEEILGRDMAVFFTPEDREAGLPRRELEIATATGIFEDENWLVRKDGSPFWASGISTAIADEAGALRGFVKIYRDHTRRHAAEEALQRSEEKLRAALRAARMGTWLWDIRADRQALDASLARLMGLSEEARVGSLGEFLALIDPRDRRAVAAGFDACAREGASLNVEFRVPLPGGGVRWLRDQGDVIRDDAGRPASLTGACMDITERKRMEQELARAREELERRVEERTAELVRVQTRALQSERLAAIGQAMTALAHESRNTIQRGQSYLERLSWRVQNLPEESALLGQARTAQDDLLRLYENVREYAAPLQLRLEEADLSAVWRQAWEALEPVWREKGDRLIEEAGDTVPRCRVDPFRLGQVFRNVFDNALASKPGPVSVTLHCEEASLEGRPAVRLSIRDDGPGLSDEQKRRLFEAFYTTKVKGTGLGMAIAHQIVEAHGGLIGTGDGAGAEILITLPRSREWQQP